MLESKYTDPLEAFVVHGIKTVTSYDYVLLVDKSGKAVIKRIASDSSDIKFTAMHSSSIVFDNIATDIDSFWVSPESHTYKYIFQL